jgi:hypothetical protein
VVPDRVCTAHAGEVTASVGVTGTLASWLDDVEVERQNIFLTDLSL